MRTIVIDGLSALRGGGQTYLQNLFLYYKPSKDWRIIAILPGSFCRSLLIDSNIEVITSPFASKSIIHRACWYRFYFPGLLKKLKANVLYCVGGTLAPVIPKDCKSAVAFRNMLPFSPQESQRYGFGYMRVRLFILYFLQLRSFQRAALTIFISHYAKSVIDKLLPNRCGKSEVIPHGLNEHFLSLMQTPRPHYLPNRYVLYVSILDVYKAQIEVIQAWNVAKNNIPSDIKLLLVGPEYPPYAQKVRAIITELQLQETVVLCGNIDYQKLPEYYKHAEVNLFASSCENCPNILLEALGGGRPILCSNYPPMPEFAGDAVLYFDPYDPNELAHLLVLILHNEEKKEDLRSRAQNQSLKYSWQETAEKTWNALRKLADGKYS